VLYIPHTLVSCSTYSCNGSTKVTEKSVSSGANGTAANWQTKSVLANWRCLASGVKGIRSYSTRLCGGRTVRYHVLVTSLRMDATTRRMKRRKKEKTRSFPPMISACGHSLLYLITCTTWFLYSLQLPSHHPSPIY
jgi:hypothetical protein